MLYQYLKDWGKNPQWSFSCCLALLLPLNDLHGEISGLAQTNVLTNQLQTGEIEMPTVYGAVKDSGAIDVTLEENEQDDNAEDVQDYSCDYEQENKTKCHRGTQTKLIVFSLADVVFSDEKDEKQKESGSQ